MSAPTRPRGRGDRPRVALVLSGGGARGAYEAGVLRYLREDLAVLREGMKLVDRIFAAEPLARYVVDRNFPPAGERTDAELQLVPTAFFNGPIHDGDINNCGERATGQFRKNRRRRHHPG